MNYNAAWLWSPSGGALDVNTRLQAGSPGVSWLSSLNQLGQMTAYTTNHKAAVLTPTGTLNWTGPNGGCVGGGGGISRLVLIEGGRSWDTSRLYVDGVLSVTAVPEPGSRALLLGGGVALARRLRRPR